MESPRPSPSFDPATEIRAAAHTLSSHRGRPCLAAVIPHLVRRDIPGFLAALDQAPPGVPLDVLLASHGGCIDTAYVMARALARRQSEIAVFVPICAKNAATLVALVASELVMGPLGELGPIDAQFDRKRQADFSGRCSELAIFKAFEQAGDASLQLFEAATHRILNESGMTPFDAAAKAADLVGVLMGRVYEQLDPLRVGEGARALEVATELGRRVIRRYRPELEPKQAEVLLNKLVHDYPCHGFPLDFEELVELGVPVRPPTPAEHACLDRLGRVLLPIEGEVEVLEVIDAEATDGQLERPVAVPELAAAS